MSTTPRAKRRLLLLSAFSALLLVQGVASFAIQPEPYPTVRMPSFGASPSSEGLFPSRVMTITVTYSDGSTLTPSVPELADDMRFSAARTSLPHAFAPGQEVDDETRAWLQERAAALADGVDPVSVEFCWQDAAIDVSDASLVDVQACESSEVTFA